MINSILMSYPIFLSAFLVSIYPIFKIFESMDKNSYGVARELLIVKNRLNQLTYYCEQLETRIEQLESRNSIEMFDKSITTIEEEDEEEAIEEEPPKFLQEDKKNKSEEDLEIIEMLNSDSKKNVKTWSSMIGLGF